MRPEQRDGRSRLDRGVTLVEQLQGRVGHRLERGDDEDAARGRELAPDVRVLQDVLDLDRAVERQVGKARMDRAHDSECVVDAVEEVRIPVGHVTRSHRDLLRDVRDHRVDVVDPDAPVIHDRYRAVTAAVHTAAGRLDRSNQMLLARPDQARVPFEWWQEVARGQRSFGLERGVVLDPPHQFGVRIATHESCRHVTAHRRVEPVTRDGSGNRRCDLSSETRRGVHRYRERDLVRPRTQGGFPRLDREVEAANVVAASPQTTRRPGNGERLMAELIGRDEQHLHVMTISMRAPRPPVAQLPRPPGCPPARRGSRGSDRRRAAV